jgi:HAD superfamily hydrolase (TIGR01509 family)
MIKAFLFDADGVVIKPHKYFSQRLRDEGKDIPEEKVSPFFKNEYKKVAVGKSDLKVDVQKYLSDWNWKGSVEELLHYWFSGENKTNLGVIRLVQKLRKKGYKCYIVSDHSKYRADDLKNNVGLGKYFDEMFFSGYVGHTKEELEFFEKVLKKIGRKPSEVVFIDDDIFNVKIAEKTGIVSYQYKNVLELWKLIKKQIEV